MNDGVKDTDGQENTVVCVWDSSGGLAGGADATMKYNADAAISDIGSYVATNTVDKIRIGQHRGGGGNAPDAFISRVRIWRVPQ